MADWMTPARLDRGYVIVLPGIEGRSLWNGSIVRGLLSGGVDCAVEIHDWTLGPLLMLLNLRWRRRHRSQAERLRDKIVDYQGRYPGRPVWIIGHSGGGGMAVYALLALPDAARITGAVLLSGALSPRFELAPALARLERGLWNVRSQADVLFCGALTMVFGTIDGRNSPSCGVCGFRQQVDASPQTGAGSSRLIDVPYRWRMARCANFGGHFGCVTPWFVRDWIAPLVRGGEMPTGN